MFQTGLKHFPHDFRTVVKLAHTFDNLRQFDLAEEQLARAQELDPHLGLLNSYYGLHYRAQGMLEEAEMQFLHALELSADDKIARAGLEEVQKILEPIRAQMLAPATTEIDLSDEPAPKDNAASPEQPAPNVTPSPRATQPLLR